MTAEFEGLALLLLTLLVIVCIVQLVFAAILFRYMKRIADALGAMRAGDVPAAAPPAREVPVPRVPEPKPAEAKAEPRRPRPSGTAAPVRAEILKDRRDILGSAQSLSEKYELTDYLIATLDGLVVVSLHPGSAEEAARASDLFRRKKKPDAPGVTFLGIRHRGEPMLAVMKSDRPLGPGELKGIGEDSEKILNWWL